MKTLYLELNMGAAGDMLAAALASITENPDEFIKSFEKMKIPSVVAELAPLSRGGICGKSFSVSVNGHHEEDEEHHHGHSLHDIRHIVDGLDADEDIKSDILKVYNVIAEAESCVHGVDVREIHFHEVGMMDAIADIAAVCLAMKMLSPDRIVASPVHVGCGQVRCAHGVLPVPAPATAEILKGVPIYGGEIKGELCTPTGAALLKYFVTEFGSMPAMSMDKIGYGMGKKEFSAVNCVRAIIGESKTEKTELSELSANIDDMTGEDIAFATERIFEGGALDVWTQSIGMKKSRPGIMLCALCEKEKAENISGIFFKHTTTLGIREKFCTRRVLSRKSENVETELGTVRKKHSEGYGITREKLEYEDIAALAKEHGMSLCEIRKLIEESGDK